MVDLDQLPLYELQMLSYQFWQDREAEEKMSDKEKAGAAFAKVIADNV